MDWQKNISSTFNKKSHIALSEIMKKYNLEENDQEFFQKTTDGKPHNVLTLTMVTMAFLHKQISENEMTDFIQKQVGVSAQTASDVTKDIIKNLIPIIPTDEDIAKRNEEYEAEDKQIEENLSGTSIPRIKAPIEVEKIMAERRADLLKEKIIGSAPVEVSEPVPAPTRTKKSVSRPIKNDPYKEPIE